MPFAFEAFLRALFVFDLGTVSATTDSGGGKLSLMSSLEVDFFAAVARVSNGIESNLKLQIVGGAGENMLKSSADVNNGSKCGAPVGVPDARTRMCMQLAASKAVLNGQEIEYIYSH